jgi:hypothetical protein
MTFTLRGCSPAQRSDVGAVDSSSSADQPPPLPLAPVLAARLARQAEASGEGDRGKRKVVEAGVTTRHPTARKFTLSKKAREALELSDSEGEKQPAATHDRAPDEQLHSKVKGLSTRPSYVPALVVAEACPPLDAARLPVHTRREGGPEEDVCEGRHHAVARGGNTSGGGVHARPFQVRRPKSPQKPSTPFFLSHLGLTRDAGANASGGVPRLDRIRPGPSMHGTPVSRKRR